MGRNETAEIKLEKKKLTAAQARKITEETVTPLIHIYQCIKELATEGLNKLTWDAVEMDSVTRTRIIKQLESDGYKVDDSKQACLEIFW